MSKFDPKSIERLAKKNREASRAAYDAEREAQPAKDARDRKKREKRPDSIADPRYEGADRLFDEMRRRDRP